MPKTKSTKPHPKLPTKSKTLKKSNTAKQTHSPSADASDVKKRAGRVYKKLTQLYPDAECALVHRNPFELLIATILSAQCTDVRVNMVTPGLFKRFPSPKAFAAAPIEDIEEEVRSTGFYRNKAKSIQGASRLLVDEHNQHVPDTMEDLLKLPGVARKTANVVLGNAFNKNEGVVVDTHVGRLSRRLGFTEENDPKKIEINLSELFPRQNWTILSHLLIYHGRQVCSARKPKCDQCKLARDCPQIGV